MKANEVDYFSNLFDKVLYMFRLENTELCTGGWGQYGVLVSTYIPRFQVLLVVLITVNVF